MRSRRSIWILLLLLLAGAWFFWPHGNRRAAERNAAANKKTFSTPGFTTTRSGSTAPQFLTAKNSTNAVKSVTKLNPFPWRLSNTKKSLGELAGDRHAILLENALIDTGAKLDLGIPKNLLAQGDPGAYIVQARGPVDAAFRAQLAAAGAQIVSYIPNDAYLVRVSAGGADQLAAQPLTQAVIPYEPYYKISSSLIGQAVEYPGVLPSAPLTLGLFANNADETIADIKNLGGQIIATGSSPFGPTVRVLPPQNWTALAGLPGVQIVEPFRQRVHANDLSRVTTEVAADTITTTNYMNLTGSNVLVAVDDSGIDATHPDFNDGGNGPLRVIGATNLLVDTDGHGTFVAGQIAGDGFESTTVTNVSGSINPGTTNQYRGGAPLATLLSLNYGDSDQNLQAAAALTNALISNNSWNYDGDTAYDLAAASYDAATRDSLPRVTGSQPVLYVFSAGNEGNGDDTADPGGGDADTILSPATGKNVITVGAIQQLRNITNQVTEADGTTNMPWAAETSTDYRIAGFSSRGNVGIGTEGPNGRDKPDVVAPGTFVVSTRSSQWDIASYFYQSPTNYDEQEFDNIIAQPDSIWASAFPFLPNNTVQATIQVLSNPDSPVPFPNLPIYVGLESSPGYDFFTTNNAVSIPPDGGAGYLNAIFGSQNFVGFNYAVSNITSEPISFDVITDVITTNSTGDYFIVLSNLDQSIGTLNPSSTGPGPYYRYESGTSMSAADVSGVLALMQDFFTNTLHATPSPALMKAMLINGARPTGYYNLGSQNTINYEGWGLIQLPNSLPLSITNLVTEPNGGTNTSVFFLDQSPTNALATGDSQTFTVTLDTNSVSVTLPLRVTLAWTDPPGNPAAAIKLVNGLELIVTNLATGDVYYGNDIPSGSDFNSVWDTNGPPNVDTVNNIENVFLAQPLSGSYSITIVGRDVNVNAVTAQTNNSAGNFAPNVVQDYALVASVGGGFDGGAISVAPSAIVSNPTGDQQITFVTTTNTPLFNQFAGGNTPLLGTNTVDVGGTNAAVTVGMTNQWHFYVVTNVLGYANVAFVTFLPNTLAIPRMGAFADSAADATQPEADIDMYVASDPDLAAASLTNLNPMVISNCVNGLSGDSASLTRGGTEFVTYSNSVPGQVYYIGVKSEDQEAAEYAFIPVFSATPFSATDQNGDELLQGVPLPVNIPDGSPKHPGSGYVFALATLPIQVARVVVTNTIVHENYGDLIGVLNHDGVKAVLNNHDSLGNPPGPYTRIYDDSGQGDVVGAMPSDGPGSLKSFQGQLAVGPWILTETDDSLTQTGAVTGFNLFIQKYQDPLQGVTVTIPPETWFYTFLDVPPGYTNLTVAATNLDMPPVTPPLQLYLNFGSQPDFSNYLETTSLTNGSPPGNSLVYGPPLQSGTYYIGIYNSSSQAALTHLIATLGGSAAAIVPSGFATNGTTLLDDAAGNDTIFVGATQQVASVNVAMVVKHPRISDLTFTLVSPSGQRVLLMENRGGATTNGAGNIYYTTNYFAPVTANGGGLPQTNFLNVGQTSGTLTINYNMFTVPDEMTVYDGTNSGSFTTNNAAFLFDTGFVSNTGTINVPFAGTSTYVTIIMNQFGNSAGPNGTAWTYTAGGVQTNYNYLTFTEDTNLTTIPIKFAIPPYDLSDEGTNFTLCDFELATNGDYLAPTNIYDAFGGWNLTNVTYVLAGTNLVAVTNNANMVSVVADPDIAAGGSNFLALAYGTIYRQIPMTVGRQFSLSYFYRGPGISAWYRGEGNATDSSDPESNGNNGWLIGRFNYPAGEVGQSFEMQDAGNEFQFAGTNTYVQIRQAPFPISVIAGAESNGLVTVLSSALDVGTGPGFTVEGWINPTNVSFQQPLVEWLARTPTNLAMTNLVIEAGPFLNPATSHYYYMLGSTDWVTSENWATQLGGHLVTIETANEQNWVFDTFANYGGVNRNLWIGLTNSLANPTNFVWSSGLVTTNTSYFNWLTDEPTNCSGADFYTTMLGGTNKESGLWLLADVTGHNTCDLSPTNKNYGVVEVTNLQPNGVQFWISVTNVPGTTNFVTATNGCLFANLVDTTNGSHLIFSAPGLIQSNVFQHVALTYDTNSGLAMLYLNGTNVASTNWGGGFVPATTGDVLLGKDMSQLTNNYFGGEMDEMSIYARSLSASEIAGIYQSSALTTNRNLGKFDPSITPALGLAEAQVSLGGSTNLILGANNTWQSSSFSFTATTNTELMQITGLEPGMLLDTFDVSEAPLGNLYYQPEQTLATLDNTSAYGTWTLEILDDRTGAYITNGNQLVNWQLQLVLQTNTPAPIPLSPQEATAISVPPGQIVYLSVPVPPWANYATNLLDSADLPVDLLFNQTNQPTGGPNDTVLISNMTAPPAVIGNPVLSATSPSTPPLVPGQTYYLGVRNNGAHAATVTVEVDFDIMALTNGIPLSSTLKTNDEERYFSFNVSSNNATEATFQLLKLSGNADLVVRKGGPLPTLTSSDYGSFNASNADESIYVLMNSLPVPLTPGLWYVGVIKRDSGPVSYTVLAKELDTNAVTIINLTNGVPFNYSAVPGAALTTFFSFNVANTPGSIQFELYNLTGNGDLTVQTNGPPLSPPFYQTSQQPGLNPEFIFIATNSALSSLTNSALTNLNATWYLGVPNNEATNINYTILALINTNPVFPAFPGAEGAGAGAAGGGRLGFTNATVYHVVTLNDSGAGSLRDAVSSTNRTIVFDVGGTINLAAPLVITNSYLTIAGQTAPGCCGITVAGYETSVTNAHDLIIRDVRFRPGSLNAITNEGDALQFVNVSNVIADHVSTAWSVDDLVSAFGATNLTVQWSVLSDSLENTNGLHGGSQLRYGNGALSFHHNLYADNYSASPRLGDNLSLDFVNNVIYDWVTNAGYTLDDTTNNPNGFTNQLNYVCNYLIASTNSQTPGIAFWGGSTNTWIYQTNNFIDSDTNGVLNGADTQWNMFTNRFTKFGRPFPLPSVTTYEAYQAYERVLDFAGDAMCARDGVDADIVTGVRTQTGTIISTPPALGLVAWWKAENNALDSVGTNNGSLVGGVTFTNGVVGQAFVFAGGQSSNVVDIGDPVDLQFTNSFSIGAWIFATGLPTGANYNQANIFFRGDTRSFLDPYAFAVIDTGGLRFHLEDAVGNIANLDTTTTIPMNQWAYVTAVFDGSSGLMQVYLNGQIIGSTTTAIRPFQNLDPTHSPGVAIGNCESAVPGDSDSTAPESFNGRIDEVQVYNRSISGSEIQATYQAGLAGKSYPATSCNCSALPPLDSDRDGIPDYWEITFGQDPTNASSYLPSTNAPGYTDLEEYINWLAAPHALTVTNTPVDVDLYKLAGKTGNLSFAVTNAVQGFVYLTNVLNYTNSLGVGISVTNTGPWSNSIAVFTPTNNPLFAPTNYSGYASFDFYVTNNDTVAYFGPETVSVVVSAVPIVYASANTNVPPMFTNGAPANQTINELTLMTVTNTATLVNTNLTLTYAVTMSIDTNAMMLNGWPLNYASTAPLPVIDPNGIITWTPSEAQGPGVYIITTVVSDSSIPPLTATNSFSVTVNEVNLAPFWPTNVPSQTNYTISALTLLTVTNTAADSDIPPNPLSYQLSVSPAVGNAAIDTNGVITWTPSVTQIGLYTFTTVVTDTNQYALFNQSLSATNVFTVLVTAVAAPYVFTEPAQSVTGSSAQLNGMVTPNGLPTTAWFQWGTNTSYGNLTPPVGSGAGYNVVYTTNLISGLVTNVAYHFRLVASNAVGVVYGFDQILDEANVVAWGADYAGQLSVPLGLSNVTAIAGAYDHSLALKINGKVVVWGDNTFGQTNVPASLSNAVAVAGGESYSLALRNSGTVAAWGANIFPGETNVPAGLSNVVLIASGQYSSLALKNIGTVVAWGANISGLTNVPANLSSNTVAIAGGNFHNLAVKNDGTVVAWGDDSIGQTDVPAGLSNVVAIAAGGFHSLALQSNGIVVAWGDDSAGQTNVPSGLSNVVAIAAGGFHSLALKNDGTVVAWGDDSAGQSSVPVGLTNVVAIAGGNLHSLVLTPQFNFNSTNPIVLNDGVAVTNTILAGGITYYQVNVPANVDFATNSLLFALNGSLNVWFTTNPPPFVVTNSSLLLAGATNGVSILSTNSSPTNIVPGATYYLAVQNTNSVPVTYGIEVDFHFMPAPSIPISSITATNIGGKFGFLLEWFAPTNDIFQVQWTGSLVPVNWQTFSNIITYTGGPTPTNGLFTFFDDGSQFPFGPTRFYRLILLGSGSASNTPPVLPSKTTQIVNPLNPLIVTNTATDSDVPAQTLAYNLSSTVTGTNQPTITTNGVITWTPDVSQAGTSNLFTTIVTDNGTPNLSATNSFSVIVNPVPSISSVTYSNGTFLLTWWAPTNDIFQVQLKTNLVSSAWLTFTNIITYTGPATPTNGLFSFLDDGSQYPSPSPRFYQLILIGVTMPANTPPSFVATPTNQIINALNPLIVTNAAIDAQSPPQVLTYALSSTVTGTNQPAINVSNGVITWTPDVSQAGTSNLLTTIVSDNGTPLLSATNSFSVIVNPVPSISSITYSNGNYLLTWLAPTNDIFEVQVATNLASPVWQTIGTNITYTGPVTPTNGWFSYLDNGTQVPFGSLRFYRLILTGVTTSASPLPPAVITSIVLTNGDFLLTWFASTNDQFNVRWTTNIVPPMNWTLFPNNISPYVITSTNGTFTFLDTNAPMLMKFYDLILLP